MACGDKGSLVESNIEGEDMPGEDMPPAYDETKGLTGGGDGPVPEVKIAIDTKIDKGKEQDQGFQGLSKEELMQYANDPFWVRLRWILFILFWIIWVAMLVASVVIIVYAPKCPSPEPKSWWHKGPVYKVDLDDAATPSIQKLTENLNYFAEAGVGTFYITSFYPSSGKATQGSVDINNYQDVDAKYGNMDDWAALVRGLKERDQKVLLDFIPNHTADDHEWFVKSVAKDPDFDNFYIWADEEPSATSGQWTYSEVRSAWYLSKLDRSPDLNLSNKAVIAKLEEILKFWLDTGVDGFVVNDLPYLVDDDTTTLVSILDSFRTVVDEETEKSESPKVLVASSDNLALDEVPKLVDGAGGNNVGRPLHLLFSNEISNFITSNGLTSKSFKRSFDYYNQSLPTNVWPTITYNSVDLGPEMVDSLTMFKMMIPATSLFTSGEELGLANLDFDEAKEQKAAKESHLKLFSNLAQKLRHQDAILFGELSSNSTFVIDDIFGITRVKKGNPGYLLLVNFGESEATVDLKKKKVKYIADSIRVMAKSVKPVVNGTLEGGEEVSRYDSNAVTVKAKEGKIFTFVPNFKED